MSLLHRLRQFRTLARHERWLLLQSLGLLPLVSVALRLVGFQRCVSLMKRLARAPQGSARTENETESERIRTMARLVDVAARNGVHRPNCLTKSLVLWFLVRTHGLPAELKIGVRRGASRLQAHAWVELAGQVLNDTQDVGRRFKAFPDIREALRSL